MLQQAAAFAPGIAIPTVAAEDGTIYGQATPRAQSLKADQADAAEIELHYFHLWRQDCGPHGHPLDTEHVAVLVRLSGNEWKAIYWYAAAHEQTVCDVSQIARASTLHAEDKGARVWISPGKHASYLDARLCRAGCGADLCESLVPLTTKRMVNLGEVGHAMNASAFIPSDAWPLKTKMEQTNFPAEAVARLEGLPDTDIAWFHPGRHPLQGVIGISGTTEDAIGKGSSETASSLDSAGDSTADAISMAGNSTDDAVATSYHETKRALGRSLHDVGRAIRVK